MTLRQVASGVMMATMIGMLGCAPPQAIPVANSTGSAQGDQDVPGKYVSPNGSKVWLDSITTTFWQCPNLNTAIGCVTADPRMIISVTGMAAGTWSYKIIGPGIIQTIFNPPAAINVNTVWITTRLTSPVTPFRICYQSAIWTVMGQSYVAPLPTNGAPACPRQ